MKTICLFAIVAVVIACVLADHSQHQAGVKPGDVVHWTTSNTKGAATLNHTSHAKQETGLKTSTTSTTTAAAVTTAETTITTATVAAGPTVDAAKPIDQGKVPAAPVPEPGKDTTEAVTITAVPETPVTPAAAAPDAKNVKPAETKPTHK